MRRGLSGVLICAAAAGCAVGPSNQGEPTHPPQEAQPPQTMRPQEAGPPAQTPLPPRTVEDTDRYLEHLFADPRLDPIRDKVPLLLRADTVTASHLSNPERPTEQERRAIAVWESVRERAQQYQQEQRGPPSPLLVKTRSQVTRAILQLYGGELTYGEFAARIQEVDADYQAAARKLH
jgi:hypothetical protein